MSIQFAEFTKDETRTVSEITKRAFHGELSADILGLHMDIAAVHAHTPLRLEQWLKANPNDFAHDVLGIRRHLNRETGELMDCFMPRFARA